MISLEGFDLRRERLNPEDPVPRTQPWLGTSLLQHGHLLVQRQVLRHQSGPAQKPRPQQSKQQSSGARRGPAFRRKHSTLRQDHRRRKSLPYNSDGIFGRHRSFHPRKTGKNNATSIVTSTRCEISRNGSSTSQSTVAELLPVTRKPRATFWRSGSLHPSRYC